MDLDLSQMMAGDLRRLPHHDSPTPCRPTPSTSLAPAVGVRNGWVGSEGVDQLSLDRKGAFPASGLDGGRSHGSRPVTLVTSVRGSSSDRYSLSVASSATS